MASAVRHGDVSRNGPQGPVLELPGPALDGDPTWRFLGSGSRPRGEASGYDVGQHKGLPLMIVPTRSRAGYFVCRAPVLNDNDIRGDSTTGVPGFVRQVTLFRTHRRMVGNRGAS